MFADIYYKLTSSQARKVWFQSSRHTKTEFNVKWPLMVIQGHVFWGQWKGDKGLHN